MGLNLINASDGTGEAVRASVTNPRTAGSGVIVVDSVDNWPANFIATTGKETVDANGNTILDPATILVFAGHISGSTIVIDTLAPGYTDTLGSSVDDVVLIKPSTMWADEIATLLAVSHNNDGTIKNNTVNTANIVDGAVTGIKQDPNTADIVQYTQGGSNTEYSLASMGDVLTVGTSAVPSWATKAIVSYTINPLIVSAVADYSIRIKIGSDVGNSFRVPYASFPTNTMFSHTVFDEITLTGTGSKSVVLQAQKVAGTGTLRFAASASAVTIRIDYR